MKTNIQPLSFDEFGTPECSWKEARSTAKKRHLAMAYFILTVDLIALVATLANYPYSSFDIFQIAVESLVLVLLLPKILGLGKSLRCLSVDEGILKIKSGIVYRKSIPLQALDKVSISKKRNSHRRLVLHHLNGKKEETRFFISLPSREDKEKIIQWKNELNDLIQKTQ